PFVEPPKADGRRPRALHARRLTQPRRARGERHDPRERLASRPAVRIDRGLASARRIASVAAIRAPRAIGDDEAARVVAARLPIARTSVAHAMRARFDDLSAVGAAGSSLSAAASRAEAAA